MSMAQTTTEPNSSSDPRCPHCNATLPRRATFCASCGERLVTKPVSLLLQDDADISTRYRITSLVRRRPYVNLLLALDNQQSRPVAIRDIDITGLNEDGRLQACAIVQQEYDLLRRERIASIMPVIDIRHFKGHLYVVAGWPFDAPEKTTHLHTLQDVLQSGIGLPGTQTAFAWIEQLCASLAHLHSQHIVLGDLDPQTLILGGANYDGNLELMVSWLPPTIRAMLPDTSILSNGSNYSAPEVFLGKPEPRSDVYSLGGILYILLTGVPPDEATARMHRRLRTPSEVNPRIHSTLDEFVMKALALDSADRFQNMADMAEALAAARARKRPPTKASAPMPPMSPPVAAATAQPQQVIVDDGRNKALTVEDIINIDTVQVTPLPASHLEAWRAAPIPPVVPTSTPSIVEGAIEPQIAGEEDIQAGQVDDEEIPVWRPPNSNGGMSIPPTSTRGLRKRVTGLLPALSHPQSPKSPKAQPASTPTRAVAIRPPDAPSAPEQRKSLLKQLQQFILGEQKHSTAAAAIIETPMRVQPQQTYAIRIQLMGRNAPELAQNGTSPGGLSALVDGQMVYIEVRSALYQNYAYIVQQATVQIPADGFAAEVTIPMKPLSVGPSGRRDRLHIFFMDEMRRPLYEKPFIIELFVSHLVQPGREGHNVLTIPL